MARGRYKFRVIRLSDMMPNSWFCKLRNFGRRRSRVVQNSMAKTIAPIVDSDEALETRKITLNAPQKQQDRIKKRQSYYVNSRNRDETIACLPARQSKPLDNLLTANLQWKSEMKSGKNSLNGQSSDDPISEAIPYIPLFRPSNAFDDESVTVDRNIAIDLPPIMTKPDKKEDDDPNLTTKSKRVKQGSSLIHGNTRMKSTPATPRIRIRVKSPRLSKKRLMEKKGLADSLVVVKSSSNPQRDFRESMEEMILENELWASNDLEELLYCYLALNSDDCHDLIVKTFKQIWFDLSSILLISE